MTHSQLPDAILEDYPDLTLDDLKQDCWGVFYHYTVKGLGIVGGYDFGFYIYKKGSRTKQYFDNEKGLAP